LSHHASRINDGSHGLTPLFYESVQKKPIKAAGFPSGLVPNWQAKAKSSHASMSKVSASKETDSSPIGGLEDEDAYGDIAAVLDVPVAQANRRNKARF
jgi:hypothetical protein